ncbi:hypothetical protein PM082_003838 [Marasmius tenuissimus]|nr:hypothetical protein PM082_003838 [Marasmius tenuissimus]
MLLSSLPPPANAYFMSAGWFYAAYKTGFKHTFTDVFTSQYLKGFFFRLSKALSSSCTFRSMLSSKPRKSHEGKVGAIFEKDNVFVTTPNQSFIAPPLLGERTIKLRRDFHFGEEDPLYFPQRFSNKVPHLSVVPFPSADPSHKYAIAWRILSADNFVPLKAGDPHCTLGLLSNSLRIAMKKAVDEVIGSVSGLTASGTLAGNDLEAWKNDRYSRSYVFGLKSLLARLDCPASYKESSMAFALCQRAYLELVARVSWFQNFLSRVRDPIGVPHLVADVVGALTGDFETCERLYRAGIPVWLVRPLDRKEGLRVDQWVDVSPTTELIPLRKTGMVLSLVDASPPHPILYRGLISPESHEHYRLMGEFLRQFSTTNVYVNEAASASTTSHPSLEPASGPSRQKKPPKKSRDKPYSNPARSEPQKRNKFVDVQSPLMPKSLPAWKAASEAIGSSFEDKMPSLPGLDDGYAVPDPNIIVGGLNETAKVRYVTTTLKLRPLLLYRLRSPTFRPYRTREWRGAVGIEAHPLKGDSRTGKRRVKMIEVLKECLASGNLEVKFDFDDLSSVPVEWKGQRYVQDSMPPTSVVQEFLCELFEINFRYELVALDRLVNTTTMSKGEREQEVLGTIPYFNSSLIPQWSSYPETGCGREGLASESISMRRATLLGLFKVMEGWNGGKYAMPRPLVEGMDVLKYWEREATEQELFQYEKGLAHHYVSSFSSVFGRAPLLPHKL